MSENMTKDKNYSYKNTPVTKEYLNAGDELHYRIIADTHYGEHTFDRRSFRNAMDDAVEQDRGIILLGDMITSILPGDSRYSKNEHETTFADQEDWLERIISHYSDNLEWVFQGNHEQTLIKSHGDFMENICERNEVRYGGFQLNIRYQKQNGDSINFYLTHGRKTFNYRAGEGRRKKTNKQVRVKDLLRPICEADLYVMGHAHDGVLSTDPYELKLVNRDGQNYEERYLPEHDDKVYCCCPSMLRTYQEGENYASRSMIPPSEVGYIDVDISKGLDIEDVQLVVSNNDEFIVRESYKDRRNKR